MPQICITGTGYFGAQRQRVKQLAKTLDLRYSGELIFGISTVLVVADCSSSSQAELLTGLKAKTAALWGNVAIVSHQWLEDSAQQGALSDVKNYALVSAIPQQHASHVTQANSGQSSSDTAQQVLISAWSSRIYESKVTCTEAGIAESNISDLETEFLNWTDSPEVMRQMDHREQAVVLEHCCSSGSAKVPQDSGVSTPLQLRCSTAFCSPHEHAHSCKETNIDVNVPTHPPVASDEPASKLIQQIDNGTLLPEPLQLLYNCEIICDSNKRSSAHALTGDSSPGCFPVKVAAGHRLKKSPRNSTAAEFHGASAGRITYYDTLTIQHPELDTPLEFSMRDCFHCALVYYDDSTDGQTCDLAYAQLLHCYKLEKDETIYIEHMYLYDADDIRNQKLGNVFLAQHPMADLELVHSAEVYHSLAEAIEGEFWLTNRKAAEKSRDQAEGSDASRADLHLFCEVSWDRLTGCLLPGQPSVA